MTSKTLSGRELTGLELSVLLQRFSHRSKRTAVSGDADVTGPEIWFGQGLVKFRPLILISDTVVRFNICSPGRSLWVIGTGAPAIKAPKTNSITTGVFVDFSLDALWHLSQMMFDFWTLETFNGVHSAISWPEEPSELWLCCIDLSQCVYWLRSPESLLEPVKGQ